MFILASMLLEKLQGQLRVHLKNHKIPISQELWSKQYVDS